MTVEIKTEHCIDSHFGDIHDCPLNRALRQQHPELNVLRVGGRTLDIGSESNYQKYPIDTRAWNIVAYNRLLRKQIPTIVLNF